ncbi:MAG: ATP-binding protein [Archangium sp.]
MRDVLRWALPTCAVLSVITLTTVLATGMFPRLWSRGVPSLLLLSLSLAGLVLLRLDKLIAAIACLIGGIGSVLAITMTFNGGLRAPAVTLLFFLIAVCGWVFGRLAATVMALIAAGVLSLFFVLGATGVSVEPSPVPLVAQFVMLMVMVGLLWVTSANPPERMRLALLEAQTRERKRLEADQQFQAVFDQTPHLMWLLTPEGLVQSANRAALRFAGLQAEAVLGKPFASTPWWNEGERAEVTAAIVRAQADVVRFETTHSNAQQQVRAIDFSLSPFRGEDGKPRFVIAESRDITDLVALRERRNTNQRLELVGQLAGGVAHDFNNVLMAILASTEVLRLELGDGAAKPEVNDSLDTILDAGRRAGDLTRRLLTFGRRSTRERRTMSLNEVLQTTAKLLERTLPADVRLDLQAKTERSTIVGDVAAIESALLNLAVNARDAMPSGGTLTFTSELVELDDAWCRESGFDVSPGSYVRISVRDTGTGIAPEHLPRVFEPFFTTKEEGKGTGLGLASVFGVVREHGGTIHLSSEPGRGTVVHLAFPLSDALAEEKLPPGVVRKYPGVVALVVDDEAPIRRMLSRLLKQLGIECVQAANAEEGLKNFESRMSLVITDIVLPGRRGNELAAELLAQHPQLKVLLISGFPRDSELSTLPTERVRMLAKPFTFEALQTVLATLLGGAR